MLRGPVSVRATCWAATALIVATAARADDVHYNDYPVGNRALGLAGAFTAIANDPSGLYYNPAGIVWTSRANVSVSTSLYGLESTSPTGFDNFGITNLLDLNVIPGEVGATYSIGKLNPGEPATAAWGFDIVVPSFRNNSYNQQYTAKSAATGSMPAESAPVTDTHSTSDQTLWAGIGGAYSIRRWVSVGLTAFYLHRTQQITDSTTAQSTGFGYNTANTTLNVFDDSLLFEAGAHFVLNDRWMLGVMLMSPSTYLRSGGTAQVQRTQWGPMGANPMSSTYVADTSTDPDSLKVMTASNGGFRVGGAFTPTDAVTVSADVIGYYPVSYTRLQFQNELLSDEITESIDVHRDMVVNFALGAEWKFLEHFSVAGGGYTDFSSAPALHPEANGQLTAQAGPNALPRDNLFGGTVAVGYFSEHSLTRIGFTGVTGWGETVVYQAFQNAWIVQPLRETLGYVFISSTFRY